MLKPLIVYYSRTGGTRNVAEEIVHATGWDLDPIVDPTARAGILGYLHCGLDAVTGRHPPIEAPRLDPRLYPLVLIGTPIWNASVSAPVRAYLAQNRHRLPSVAFFATCGGSGTGRAFRQMEQLVGKAPIATLALTENQISDGEHLPLIKRFIDQVRLVEPRSVMPEPPRPSMSH